MARKKKKPASARLKGETRSDTEIFPSQKSPPCNSRGGVRHGLPDTLRDKVAVAAAIAPCYWLYLLERVARAEPIESHRVQATPRPTSLKPGFSLFQM